MPPETCPNCGVEVPPGAIACPGCGADEQTGWSDRAHADNLGIPDEQFDYDEFVKEEFGSKPAPKRSLSFVWWTAAVILVLVWLAFYL